MGTWRYEYYLRVLMIISLMSERSEGVRDIQHEKIITFVRMLFIIIITFVSPSDHVIFCLMFLLLFS